MYWETEQIGEKERQRERTDQGEIETAAVEGENNVG